MSLPNSTSQPPAAPSRPSFFRRLPDLALSYPRLTLLLCLALTLAGLAGLTRLREEEDILVFLPGSDPDVATFKDVARRFGALRVALIGVEPPAGVELFSHDILSRLDRLSAGLKGTTGVDRVVSLSTMTDLDASASGVEVRSLIPSPVPDDPAVLAALQKRALSLPQVRGNVVSGDGKAALLMIFLADGASTRMIAGQAQRLARQELAGCALYFGGAPFAGQAIYDATQLDVRRLTPLSLLLFFFVVLLSFSDWLAVVLSVGTVGIAGILVTGGMGLFGSPFTVVTSMLPVVLFAAGSQYAIHILGRYYLLREGLPAPESAHRAIRIAGPPVTIAAAATCLGFLSFLVMNIQPMRSFGLACAGGIFSCWVLALTVLPAIGKAWPRPSQKHAQLRFMGRLMQALWDLSHRHRLAVCVVAGLLAVVFVRFATQVTVRMEPSAFFRKGSEPARAQAFLNSRFGGSQFVQIAVAGDMTDPDSLREVRRLGAYARSLSGVTQVQSILDPLLLVGEAMGTGRGLPTAKQQVGNLLFFLEGEPSLRTLMTGERDRALLHVRLSGDPRPVLKQLEAYLKARWPFTPRPHTLDELAEELSWVLPGKERAERLPAIRQALQQLPLREQGRDGRSAAEARGRYAQVLLEVLKGDDGTALTGPAQRELRQAFSGGEGHDAEWVKHTLPGGMTADQAEVFLNAVEDRLQAQLRADALAHATDRLLQAAGLTSPSAEQRRSVELLASSVLDPAAPPEGHVVPLTGQVSGEPVLDRGFSRAVEQNQWASLRLAMIAVFVLLMLSLRSVTAALMCILPAGLSLAVIFGFLGFVQRPIDIGTSLVGSIVTGSGADFAMHYIWYLRRNPAREVVRSVGPILLITSVLLAAGLGILVFGVSPPLRLFGALAASGMLLSAGFTFLLVPALIRKVASPE